MLKELKNQPSGKTTPNLSLVFRVLPRAWTPLSSGYSTAFPFLSFFPPRKFPPIRTSQCTNSRFNYSESRISEGTHEVIFRSYKGARIVDTILSRDYSPIGVYDGT